jgi:hypothetical protein
MDNVTFDLQQERKRLETWLANGGRDLVRADPREIARFNDDSKQGPLAFPHLRWVPHLVVPRLEDRTTWEMPYAYTKGVGGVPFLADSTVAVFDWAADYNGARVPDARRKEPRPFLLEFVAINWKEVSFDGTDLDQKGVALGMSPEGRCAINYKLRDAKASAYGEWSQKYLKRHTAIIVDGSVYSAPYFVSRIPGNGQISGNFTQAEANALVGRLRLGDLPIAPVLLRTGPIPK